MVTRVLIALGCCLALAPGSAVAAPPPQITVAPALPSGWLGSDDYSVAVRASSSVELERLGAYVDNERVKAQWDCVRFRGSCASPVSIVYTIHPAQLSDGEHELVLTAADADSENTVRRIGFRVDDAAPSPLEGLILDGGEGFRGVNRFAVGWSAPAADAGSPVVGAQFDLCPLDGSIACLTGRRVGADLTRIDDIQVPGSGVWRLRVALEDEAGHVDLDAAAATTLRLDADPPALAFTPRDPANPARVELLAVDAGSGLADVTIEARRRGDDAWHVLTVDRTGRTSAALDDDSLPAGLYEIRGRAADAVGNERSISTWPTGGAVEVQLPVRQASRIAAGVVAPGPKKGSAGIEIDSRPLVAFGKATMLRGTLTDTLGQARAGVPIEVSERSGAPGTPWRPVAKLVTSKTGAFAYRAPSGASRIVRFASAGSPTTRGATADVSLRVRAETTLTADRRRLRNGDTVLLRGRLEGAEIPRRGKLVTLQAKVPGGWRTFGTARARTKDGRWSYRYRFTGTSTTTRYAFRIVVPEEASYPYATGTSRQLTVLVAGAG